MLIDQLEQLVKTNQEKYNRIFIRNLLKERLQYHVLNFVYSSVWGERFLFTGGTCLRFCFDLPRLSEDLDFDVKDYKKSFDLNSFCTDLKNYFLQDLLYKDKIEIQIAGNKQQIKLKFPIMDKLDLRDNTSQTNILFLRLDIGPLSSDFYEEEVSLISTYDFNFIIKRYSLSDLFASKLAAILTRSFRKGKKDRITFKGRDFYDLIWFLEKEVRPNFKRLKDITGLKSNEVLEKTDEKVEAVNKNYLKEDILPLFKNKSFVDDFCDNFFDLYKANRKKLKI